jgi:hypothetical protein
MLRDRFWDESTAWSDSGTPKNGHGELSRLINAAVVNPAFCRLLLNNPAVALARGYNGEPFRLAPEERTRVLSTQATSLAYFAQQLMQHTNGNGKRR